MKNKKFILFGLPVLVGLLMIGCKKSDTDYHKDPGAPSIVIKSSDVAVAFPGAEGFAQKTTTGGRTGRVIKVTNLNDDGDGSLRAAIQASGARIVVFNVSGIITLASKLTIANDSITIAGQTAPGDGITIKKFPVVISANNVIVRYLRFRMGDEAAVDADAVSGFDKSNIILDHCSISWATGACASFYNNTNFTLQWSIISEGLRNNVTGLHGYGGIWGGKSASFHHNLLANNDNRNPRFGERIGTDFALSDLVDFRNNVLYNWGANSISGGEAMNINVVNNYYKPGPATLASKTETIFAIDKILTAGLSTSNKWGKYYITGNVVEGQPNVTADNWKYGVYNQFSLIYGAVTDTTMKASTAFSISSNIASQDAVTAYDRVTNFAGASLMRDAVDAKVVDNTRKSTFAVAGSKGSANGFIDSQTDVGGWPVLKSTDPQLDTDGDGMPDAWEISKGLDPNFANGNYKNLSNVYDNLEVYINSLVANITTSQK